MLVGSYRENHHSLHLNSSVRLETPFIHNLCVNVNARFSGHRSCYSYSFIFSESICPQYKCILLYIAGADLLMAF